jgi:hypothetical protein
MGSNSLSNSAEPTTPISSLTTTGWKAGAMRRIQFAVRRAITSLLTFRTGVPIPPTRSSSMCRTSSVRHPALRPQLRRPLHRPAHPPLPLQLWLPLRKQTQPRTTQQRPPLRHQRPLHPVQRRLQPLLPLALVAEQSLDSPWSSADMLCALRIFASSRQHSGCQRHYLRDLNRTTTLRWAGSSSVASTGSASQ